MLCTPLFIGLAFDRGGHADSARAYLTKYVEMSRHRTHSSPIAIYLAPSLYRLGELYESAGDTKHATEYYGRFVDLWKNADPDLQPRVTEARKRIERMNRATQCRNDLRLLISVTPSRGAPPRLRRCRSFSSASSHRTRAWRQRDRDR